MKSDEEDDNDHHMSPYCNTETKQKEAVEKLVHSVEVCTCFVYIYKRFS